jgi:hypothetical protein
MIKHINTLETPKEEIYKLLKSMKSSLTDDKINNEILAPIYNNYDECLYKLSTDTCIAYRPKGSEFWIENPKNNIIYVESHTTPKEVLIQEVSKSKGTTTATILVNKWYEEYSAFVFDTSIGDVLYMLDRFRGAWSINMPNVMKYKL